MERVVDREPGQITLTKACAIQIVTRISPLLLLPEAYIRFLPLTRDKIYTILPYFHSLLIP